VSAPWRAPWRHPGPHPGALPAPTPDVMPSGNVRFKVPTLDEVKLLMEVRIFGVGGADSDSSRQPGDALLRGSVDDGREGASKSPPVEGEPCAVPDDGRSVASHFAEPLDTLPRNRTPLRRGRSEPPASGAE
jgi:hypothetical protein